MKNTNPKTKLITSFSEFIKESVEIQNQVSTSGTLDGNDGASANADVSDTDADTTTAPKGESENNSELPDHLAIGVSVEVDFFSAGKLCCGKVIGVNFDEDKVYYDIEISFDNPEDGSDELIQTVIEMVDGDFVKETEGEAETESAEEIKSETETEEKEEPSESDLESEDDKEKDEKEEKEEESDEKDEKEDDKSDDEDEEEDKKDKDKDEKED